MFRQGIVIVLPSVLGFVLGGCSFKDHMDSTQSSFQDLDQAKFAAKMALAHKGMDIETLKKRQASIDNETSERRKDISNGETYIPTYITSEPSLGATEKKKKDKKKTIEEFDGDIWELAGRSNSKAPKQDLGSIKSEL